MNIGKKWKRITAALLTTIAMALPVTAATPASVIDTTKTASLTVMKVRENAGSVYVTNGKAGQLTGFHGMSGIKFGVLKIADITQEVSGEGAGSYFTEVDGGFLQLMETYRSEVSVKQEHFTAEEMSGALSDICSSYGDDPGEKKLTEYVKANKATVHLAATDELGAAKAEKLPLGLYLVVEEDASGYKVKQGVTDEIVMNGSNPLLVSLPLTDQDSAETEGSWIYDVTVYPKNRTVSIPKFIVDEDDGDTLLVSEDYEIGETVRQVLLPGVPAVTRLNDSDKSREYTRYVVSDTMDKGLSVQRVVEVRLGAFHADPKTLSEFEPFEKLTAGTDYRVFKNETGETELTSENAAGTTSFRVVFTESGLNKLNSFKGEGQVAVLFEAVVTRDAKDGTAEPNTNRPTLEISNRGGQETTVRGNEPCVYTYRLNVKKTGVEDASKVSFAVERGGKGIDFVKESAGVYHLYDNDKDRGEGVDKETVLRPKTDGTLVIRGLDADTYTFTEKTTEAGHELLKSSFSVTLKSNDPVDGNLADAVISADGANAQIGISKGTAGFAVDNIESLVLRTGGLGSKTIYLGAALLVSMVSAFVFMKKLTKRSE